MFLSVSKILVVNKRQIYYHLVKQAMLAQSCAKLVTCLSQPAYIPVKKTECLQRLNKLGSFGGREV